MTFEEYARSEITAILKETTEKAVASYYCYARKDLKEENAKEVTEYHKSCKVAAAHLDLLIKLARWADKSGTTQEENIDEAQTEFENYRENQAGQEEDSE